MSGAFLSWGGGRLDGTSWQGILYLSISFPGLDASPSSEFAAIVTIHLNHPGPDYSADTVRVEGGRRVTGLAYEVVPAGAPLGQVVELRFPTVGDHSAYTVVLSGSGTPLRKLHPFFSSASFRFTIDCPGGDCRVTDSEAMVERAAVPPLDLLTKDYNGFLRLLSDQVKVRNPHWADLSPAAFERVLVDLLAWMGDMTSYYQDRVANEAFIETASQRYSLRQHATLLGTTLFDGQTAATVLSFDVGTSGHVPQGIQVRRKVNGPEAATVFTATARTRVYAQNSSKALQIAAWPGAGAATLPVGATELLLWLGSPLPPLLPRFAVGDRLGFVLGAWSQVVRITEVEQVIEAGWAGSPDDPENSDDATLLRLAWDDGLERELAPWVARDNGAHSYVAPLRANLVDAVHGEPRVAWIAPVLGTPGSKDVIVALDRRNCVVASVDRGATPVRLLRAVQVPEGPVAFDASESGATVPAIEVEVDGETWTRQEHLLSSRSYDTHYVATADEDGTVWVQLGDGVKGKAIEVSWDAARGAITPKSAIVLRYRVGDPIAGNTGLGTLREIVPPAPGTDEAVALAALGAVSVANVLPGSGGRQPDSLARSRDRISASIRHAPLERAVSLADYATIAMQVKGVGRAAARDIGGVFNTVLILVDPEDQGDLSEDLRRSVWTYVDRRRMAGREHIVSAPEYVALDVRLLLCVETGYQRYTVRDRVWTELKPGRRPRQGWFHPDRLSFGDQVRLSDLLAFVASLPGVRAVKATRFRRLDDTLGDPVQDTIALSGVQVARLDADPDYPEHGRLVVRVEGLDDGIGLDEDEEPPAFDVEIYAGGATP